jgi:hypothetical protein
MDAIVLVLVKSRICWKSTVEMACLIVMCVLCIVQVFGRRDDETIHTLRRPASEKRQGTKSPDGGSGWRGRYGGFGRGVRQQEV